MKDFIIVLVLKLAKAGMKFLYLFIKLFTRKKDKILMLSRQSNSVNLDFRLINEELEKAKAREIKDGNKDFKIKILCKKIPKNIFGKFRYCFHIIRCMYHIATSKICIVDGYNIPISALKHKKDTEIIQIWHAMGAVKKFGYQCLNRGEGTTSKIARIMNMHANYTLITCTSEATRKIYSEAFRTEMNKIKVLGMPRIDYILGKNNEIDEKIEELKKEYPNFNNGKQNILYVPTFRKNETIDIDKIIAAVDKEKYNLIIRLHPLDQTIVSEEYKINYKYNTFDLIKFADFVITDYSAIAFEIATLNKPLFFYVYDIKKYSHKRGVNVNFEREMKDCTRTDIREIMKIIESGKYNYNQLKKFREKYVETIDTKNSERIVAYILDRLKKLEK